MGMYLCRFGPPLRDGFPLEIVAEDPDRCEIAIHVGGYGRGVARKKRNTPHSHQCRKSAARYFLSGPVNKNGVQRVWFVVRLCTWHAWKYGVDKPRPNQAQYIEVSEARYASERYRSEYEPGAAVSEGVSEQQRH